MTIGQESGEGKQIAAPREAGANPRPAFVYRTARKPMLKP